LERRFFLKPESVTNTIFQFVLAVVSARYDVAVHAVRVLSNQ
jgi:hypothetical protein